MNPGRLPWAGMNDAFGVSAASPRLQRSLSGSGDGASCAANSGRSVLPGRSRVAFSRLWCCAGIRQVLPGPNPAVVPKPTDEANRCNLRHGAPEILQKALYVGFSRSGRLLQVVCFGWSQFPIPEACLARQTGPIYGLTPRLTPCWSPAGQCLGNPEDERNHGEPRNSLPSHPSLGYALKV
jgi:hypothetical protein